MKGGFLIIIIDDKNLMLSLLFVRLSSCPLLIVHKKKACEYNKENLTNNLLCDWQGLKRVWERPDVNV